MLTEGQKLWWVPTKNQASSKEVTVTRIGHRWAYLNNKQRLDKNTLIADGGEYSSPGKCYLSESVYLEQVERDLAWLGLTNKLRKSYCRPDGVTIADIKAAFALLKIFPKD